MFNIYTRVRTYITIYILDRNTCTILNVKLEDEGIESIPRVGYGNHIIKGNKVDRELLFIVN